MAKLKQLSPEQVEFYHEFGYLNAINVMSEEEAAQLYAKLNEAEKDHPEQFAQNNRNNAHLVFPFLDTVAHHPVIVDVVEDLLGPDILLWASVLFAKEPDASSYVSWHQDATYMGLIPYDFVTPWLALTPSHASNGCLSFIPKSHLSLIKDHTDTYAKNNILTRGQTIPVVDESKAVDIELKPGQMSLHHPLLIHGSRPNSSQHRRVGLALQSYMRPNVQQQYGRDYAQWVRGVDRYQNFTECPRPNADNMDAAIQLRNQVNNNLADILYQDASNRRKL